MQSFRQQLSRLTWLVCISLALSVTTLAQSDAPVDSNAKAADAATSGQAPDAVMKKLTELVHAGKYAEAQQLTAGMLLVFPHDQRLIKAKALLDKAPAAAGAATATPGGNPSASKVSSTQSTTGTKGGQLTGMDKVEYNALIELARQAQQSTNLEQQNTSLRQFLIESNVFLQKHPDEMFFWQIRAASVISLDNPDAGYEAGQKLLSAGAADSSDTNLQQLLAQLKIKGWLDKQKVEVYKKYGWILGSWSVSWSTGNKPDEHGEGDKEVFLKSETGDVGGHYLPTNGHINPTPDFRGAILNSGEIRWEHYMATSDNDQETPGGLQFIVNDSPGKQRTPSGWQAPISYVLSDDKRTMTMEFRQQTANPKRDPNYILQHPVTLTFVKVSDAQTQ